MSTEEMASAFGVFQAAKKMADMKKKSKKQQSGARKGKNTSNGKMTKFAFASPGTKSTKNKKKQQINGKKSQPKQKEGKISKQAEFKDSEVMNLVDQLYTDDSKKLTKKEQQKKNDLEDYLVKQLEMDNAVGNGDDNFNSQGIEDYYLGSESSSYEYSESGSFSDDESIDVEKHSSSNEDGDQVAEALAQAILSKSTKKRKSTEVAHPLAETKAKSSATVTNAILDAKKSKKVAPKTDSRKSLPTLGQGDMVINNNEQPNRHRSSLLTTDESSNNCTTETACSNVSTTTKVKLEPLSPPPNVVKLNSIEEGKRVFKWLINPVSVDNFFAKFWEKRACLIKRQQSNYFGHLISFEAIDQMLLKNHVEFTKNIDVTSYKNGVRETLNPEGRALPPVVWDHYGQGCSIRLLNPQTFMAALYTLSTTMQEYFHCLVGANAYLTPPNSQGFAPHYDDIEAFVLQIEGRKRWKLYKPRSTSEILPRYSSKNFTQEEIGKPLIEEVLEPGDVLYFPRGTIHQACTEPGYHSLHITLSIYQKQSFADLFEKMLPIMLQKAIASNVDLRRGLPLHAWQHAGIANKNTTKERADLTKKVNQLMQKCIRDMPLQDIMDAGIDQLAKKFQHEALPPEILPAEKLRTIFGSRSRTNEHGECVCDYDINERTNVRLLRANILRLVEEEQKMRIYYYLDNSKEYCEYELNFIEIEAMEAASIEVLIKSYPQYVGVSQLPLPSDEQKINLVTALWERGLLMMEKPFR